METTLLPEIDFIGRVEEGVRVYEWRAHQLWRLGVPRMLAEMFADMVDWHDVAALVRYDCPPLLAMEIAR